MPPIEPIAALPVDTLISAPAILDTFCSISAFISSVLLLLSSLSTRLILIVMASPVNVPPPALAVIFFCSGISPIAVTILLSIFSVSSKLAPLGISAEILNAPSSVLDIRSIPVKPKVEAERIKKTIAIIIILPLFLNTRPRTLP